MYTAKIENSNGEILTLTQDEERWQVVSITGLNPPSAQVNLTESAGLDGARFNSSKLDTREIVILLHLNGDIEYNRQTIYRFFRTKEWVKFYFKNKNRDVQIEGYVETCEANLFGLGELMQLTIICPQPYFRDIDSISTDMSSILSVFEFPFSINLNEPIAFSNFDVTRETNVRNDAEADTGVQIQIRFTDSVDKVKIFDLTTSETFELTYSFEDDDVVLINTNKGEKSVVLIRHGVRYNIFSSITKGSKFFQLRVGDNYFQYLADNGTKNFNTFITMIRYNSYRGV